MMASCFTRQFRGTPDPSVHASRTSRRVDSCELAGTWPDAAVASSSSRRRIRGHTVRRDRRAAFISKKSQDPADRPDVIGSMFCDDEDALHRSRARHPCVDRSLPSTGRRDPSACMSTLRPNLRCGYTAYPSESPRETTAASARCSCRSLPREGACGSCWTAAISGARCWHSTSWARN